MAQKSSNSSRATWRDYPHWSSVERFVEQVRRLDPLLVLLFGSVTTGEFTQYSDADVLVVFEHPTACTSDCSATLLPPASVGDWSGPPTAGVGPLEAYLGAIRGDENNTDQRELTPRGQSPAFAL